MTRTLKANDFIQANLSRTCGQVAEALDAECLFIKSPIFRGLDDQVRITIEDLCNTKGKEKKNKLAVLLETPGGYIEVVERICNVFRHHFKEVYFIIPNFAYSAGTVLAMSGDKIYMDYYSVLGPIDPQIEGPNGKFIPGLGYLYKYEELIEKSRNGTITDAEMLLLAKKFDPAEMFVIEQATNHSKDLIKEWLATYKFKDWKVTQTQNKNVTKKMKQKRAEDIAEILGNASRWHSHGRGISMRELVGDDIKLKIDDLGATPPLKGQVRQYYDLLIDFCEKLGAKAVIHTELGLRQIG